MGIDKKTAGTIRNLLVEIVQDKMQKYKPETDYKPFHHRLLGKDRYAVFSLVQSLNTTFGMSIWEQIAVILAQSANNIAERQFSLLGSIDNETEELINNLHLELRKKQRNANKTQEIEEIRQNILQAIPVNDPDSTVDLFVKIGNQENYIDITTVKPNKKEFVVLKKKLLRWTALRLSSDRDVDVVTRLAIPYNPYHPKPYRRWTESGLYDLQAGEILVGSEFWDTISQKSVYDDLLEIFQEVGEELRSIIDEKFDSLQSSS